MERIALFAGSFDPFTVAHFSLAKRASALFDRVIIAVGENVQKHPLFSTELRVKLIQKATANLENVCVKSYAGLTGNFATENGAKFLLRGIRSPNEISRGIMRAYIPKLKRFICKSKQKMQRSQVLLSAKF